MAARKNWYFYVYEILDETGRVIYVGKGSADRIKSSLKARGGSSCREVARFYREKDAYAYEIERMAMYDFLLNKAKGGGGSYAHPRPAPRVVRSKDDLLMSQIGTRAFCARMLLGYYKAFKEIASKVDDARNRLYSAEVRQQFDRMDIVKLSEVGYGLR